MRNKLYLLIPVLLLGLSFTALSQDSETVVMNLDQCLEYGLMNNELVKISELEIEKQKAYVGEITSEGLPQVSGAIDFNKNLQIRTTFLPAQFFDPNAPPDAEAVGVQFGTPYGGDVGINASQMIFNGSYFVGLSAAKALKELTSKEHIQNKIDIAASISKAYFLVLVSQETLYTVEANYNRLDSLLRETKILNENGFVERIEVSRTQVQFNNIKTRLENSKRSLEYSKDVLKFQMGIPLSTDLQIADKPSNFKSDFAAILNEEVNANRRIEYEILTMRRELATLDLKNNHVQYLPQFDLYFGLGWNAGTATSQDLFSFSGDNWFAYRMVGIKASVPIFDGFQKSKKIQQNRINLSQIDLQKRNLERSINNEIKDSKIQLLNSIDDLRNQQENVKLAEEVYNIARTKYQEGVGSSIELMDADNEFKVAQSNYLSALLNTLLLKVDYEKALGILLEN